MDVRSSILKMVGAVSGSWEVAAAYLGMTPAALRNRAYAVKGQALRTEHSLALQQLSGTSYFAEAIATASDGVFVRLPACGDSDGDELLLNKFNQLYAKLGTFSACFNEAVGDKKIDKGEKADLSAIADDMQRTIAELLALTFRIYCKDGVKATDAERAP